MSSNASLKTRDFISFLGDLIDSKDLILRDKDGAEDGFNVTDSLTRIDSRSHGEMIRVYSSSSDPENRGGFFMSMDWDLDKVMVLASTLNECQMASLINNWKEIKNLINLLSKE